MSSNSKKQLSNLDIHSLLNLCEICTQFHKESEPCSNSIDHIHQIVEFEDVDTNTRSDCVESRVTLMENVNTNTKNNLTDDRLRTKDKKQYQQEYYQKNADRLKQKAKDTYAENREQIKLRTKISNRARRLKTFLDGIDLELVPKTPDSYASWIVR